MRIYSAIILLCLTVGLSSCKPKPGILKGTILYNKGKAGDMGDAGASIYIIPADSFSKEKFLQIHHQVVLSGLKSNLEDINYTLAMDSIRLRMAKTIDSRHEIEKYTTQITFLNAHLDSARIKLSKESVSDERSYKTTEKKAMDIEQEFKKSKALKVASADGSGNFTFPPLSPGVYYAIIESGHIKGHQSFNIFAEKYLRTITIEPGEEKNMMKRFSKTSVIMINDL